MAKDLEKLQGTWHITALEADGDNREQAEFDGAVVVIEDDAFTSLGMGLPYVGKLEIHQSAKPKAVDMIITGGHAAGVTHLGIYKLAGDRWTICLGPRDGARPKTFATQPGTGLILETFERGPGRKSTRGKSRAQSKSPPPTPIVSSGEPTPLEGEWTLISGVFNGAPLAEDMIKWVKRTTRGNLTSVFAGPQTMLKATFTIDETKTPHAIDYMNVEGTNRGKPQAGIFELRDDTLRIAMAAPGKPRPTDFVSKSKDGGNFTTWRRTKS